MEIISTILLYALLINYVVGDAQRDGLIDRGQTSQGRIGWIELHRVIWRVRWPMTIFIWALIFFMWDSWLWRGIHTVIVAAIASLHEPVYQWSHRTRDKYTGDDSKPAWWLTMRKIIKLFFPWS